MTQDSMKDQGGWEGMIEPYLSTKTGLLGDKRTSMLENELHINTVDGRVKERGYVCYPGREHTYGLPRVRSTHTVKLALQGWPDLPVIKRRKKKVLLEKDFRTLDKGAVDLGVTDLPGWRAYRSMYDARLPPPEDMSLRRAPLIFPPDKTFGIPTRPSTPINELLEHRYQKCWIQDRLQRYINLQQRIDPMCQKEEKVHHPLGAYKETNTSRLRKYKEPVDPKPLWHMPRFDKHAEPHLNTFKTEGARQAAFRAAELDCVPRRGRFEVYRSGIREPAKS